MAYDLNTMDMGTDGWRIKTRAAEVLVRRRRNIPQEARLRIVEILGGGSSDSEVRIYFETKVGFFLWAKTTSGQIRTTLSEFNSHMNRVGAV